MPTISMYIYISLSNILYRKQLGITHITLYLFIFRIYYAYIYKIIRIYSYIYSSCFFLSGKSFLFSENRKLLIEFYSSLLKHTRNMI